MNLMCAQKSQISLRAYGETCHIRQVRADISDFVMRTFVLMLEISHSDISEVSAKAVCSMPATKGKAREEITALVLGVFYKVFS